MGRWRLAAMASALVVSALSCGEPCRDVKVRELDFECSMTSTFRGELHFDSEATFRTFLEQECLSFEERDRVDDLVAQVDFLREAVFVAAGPHALDAQRCLRERGLAGAQVCSSGLKIIFDDVYRDAPQRCPGTRWTVAFALPREDLRAALEAGDEASLRSF